jgi:hypothetical protein
VRQLVELLMTQERIESLKFKIEEAKRRGDRFIGPLVFSVEEVEEIVSMIEGEELVRDALADLATNLAALKTL